MRALITGGLGFAGRHLAKHLVECGDDVAVTYLPSVGLGQNDSGIVLPRTVQTLALDITDGKSVRELIALAQPDAIYHLAAKTFVPSGEIEQRDVFEVNLFGTINVLEAIKAGAPKARLLYVSSSEIYGAPLPGSLPLTEQSVLRPASSYGVSKAAADLESFKYFFRDDISVVRVRPFPHTGPGQAEQFALASFARQLAEIKLGTREPKVSVGNLEAKRDYSDVSDIVRGYREALVNGIRGVAYNLCSGKGRSISELLQELIAISGLEVEVVVDEARYRPVDIPDAYGSFERAHKDFGWKPRVDLSSTLSSLYSYWLEQLSGVEKVRKKIRPL